MSNQLDAFNATPPRFARAARTDAASSHEAAAKVERTGAAKAQAKRVLDALHRYPNATSAELAKLAHIERSICGRRLPELEEAGVIVDCGKTTNDAGQLVRKVSDTKCTVTGIRCVRWRPR